MFAPTDLLSRKSRTLSRGPARNAAPALRFVGLSCLLWLLGTAFLAAQSVQVIPAGSLVIAMDNDKQNEGMAFNTRAYGLAVTLLHNDIPLKWAIRTGKGKDGVDFTATATRYAPTTLPAATISFAGGPIIIHSAYATQAKAQITSWNAAAPTRRVAVYELTQDATVEIRYDLTFKPRPFVNATNSAIGVGVLTQAGITQYFVGDNAAIVGNACYTILIEPHNTNTSAASAIRSFVEGGGNFYAQCASSMAFENETTSGRYMTTGGTTGLTVSNTSNPDAYLYPDQPFSQFIGNINFGPGGSEQDWRLSTGASFRGSTETHTRAIGSFTAATQPYSSMVNKIGVGVGGTVFYNGGHDHRGTSLDLLNLQRMLLNAVLTPAARPTSCNIQISLPDLSIGKTHQGTFYVDSLATYTITPSNVGTAPTTNPIVVTDVLPAGLTYVSGIGTGWTFGVSGQTVTAQYLGALPPGATAPFTLTVRIGASAIGTVTNQVSVSTTGEVNTLNNTATHVTTVYGKPQLTLAKSVSPPGNPLPGAVLAYTVTFTNVGTAAATNLVVSDKLPLGMLFAVGSGQTVLPAGVSVVVEYSNNDGSTWTYQPVSTGCSAPAGYDACVTHVRWRLQNPLGQQPPENTGSVGFSVGLK